MKLWTRIFFSSKATNLLSLFKTLSCGTGLERDHFVLPQFAASIILQETHNQVGHMGVAKTFDAIQKTFYWSGFFKVVEEFFASCELCAKNKSVPRLRWPLKSIEVVPILFYMIGVDIIDPLKTTYFMHILGRGSVAMWKEEVHCLVHLLCLERVVRRRETRRVEEACRLRKVFCFEIGDY